MVDNIILSDDVITMKKIMKVNVKVSEEEFHTQNNLLMYVLTWFQSVCVCVCVCGGGGGGGSFVILLLFFRINLFY